MDRELSEHAHPRAMPSRSSMCFSFMPTADHFRFLPLIYACHSEAPEGPLGAVSSSLIAAVGVASFSSGTRFVGMDDCSCEMSGAGREDESAMLLLGSVDPLCTACKRRINLVIPQIQRNQFYNERLSHSRPGETVHDRHVAFCFRWWGSARPSDKVTRL